MSFTADQTSQLSAKLGANAVKSRKQGGRDVSYIEGWHAIAEANRIFGFEGWTRETVEIRCVAEREREIGQQKKQGWGVSYVTKVKVVVFAGDSLVTREGVGAGHGIDVDLGQAHESAIKEAETDAMKRALMTFGNPFGLALYDKAQANVADEEDPSKVRFVNECKDKIASYKAGDPALADWWRSEEQSQARRDFELTQAEVDDLKALVIAKLPAAQRKAA
jgi:DNA repair and recombination protein RAD52